MGTTILAGAVAPALRIMPMGDSITEWDCRLDAYTDVNDKPAAPAVVGRYPVAAPGEWVVAPGGYRGYLAAMLSSNGTSFDMVGSRYMCGNHEGWGGRTIEFLSGIAGDAITRHQPDVVLFMGGTNDFFFAPPTGTNATGALVRLRTLLDIAFAASPRLTFLLSTVTHINATRCADYPHAPWHPPACPPDMGANIDAFNGALPAVVADFAVRGLDLRLHDVNAAAAWVTEDYWIWGIHFNATGFHKMASAWYTALGNVSAGQR